MMLNKPKSLLVILYLLLLINHCSNATILVLPESGDVVGEIKYARSEVGETIDEVGRRFNIGYYEMVRANPHADPTYPLAANTSLIIPSQFILPQVRRSGIVINLSEYRLYYFPADENVVITFPVGIGKEGWNTPLGLTKITAKVANPVWRPTAKLLAAADEIGAPIPGYFPPGPNNPLGKHVLRLGWPTFLIHGTNRVDGVGARVSAGCIRMLPDDIEYLFSIVAVGTPVRVINEPVKIGREKNNIYLQIHPLLIEQKNMQLKTILEKKLQAMNIKNWDTNKTIKNELAYPSGLVKKLNG
ncbi:L,D-transpeptidase family protein [Legionella maioricensis]|uniref:L,D-transpeptidase family protein n=1 Tax=Legionella maioricensis TaxID=2896528 RepID=A0A9X2D3C4_9GAMM|nr:L,D-transpeptidase family protein [Legionella maioricensis]MCL9685589.1 L,D-transpeptidase family protein [Legionella maioricensis]MCL9688908.1 L,D-transpeptidase family protein [Legionella maioricensis]